MGMKRLGFVLLGTLALVMGVSQAFAQEAVTATSATVPAVKKYGIYGSIGNPFPSLLGVNAAYQINKDLRASVGYGELEVTTALSFTSEGFTEEKIKAQTYAAGLEYLFLDAPVRGVVGAHAGYFGLSGKGEFNISGFKKSTGYAYSNLGIDWTTRGGFNLGAGLNVAFLGSSSTGFYLNSGWYF